MELTRFLNLYKNKTLSALIIIIALIIASNIYKGQDSRIKSLIRSKEAELKKNEVINKIVRADKIFRSYQDVIKKKDINTAINTITGIAQSRGISITSLKPLKEEAGPVYTRYPFELSVSANSYHNIARFISDIENHKDTYFVDRINIKAADTAGAAYKLGANIVISTVAAKGTE